MGDILAGAPFCLSRTYVIEKSEEETNIESENKKYVTQGVKKGAEYLTQLVTDHGRVRCGAQAAIEMRKLFSG